MANNNTSEIKISIQLDENRIPEKLMWAAVEGGVELEEAKASLLNTIVFQNKSFATVNFYL